MCRLQLCCDKEIWERCQKTEKSLGFPLKLRRSRVAGSASFGVGVVSSASWCVCACTEKWCVHFVWAQRFGYVRVWRTAPRCSGPQWYRPRLPVCRSRRGHPGRCSLAGGTGRGWPCGAGTWSPSVLPSVVSMDVSGQPAREARICVNLRCGFRLSEQSSDWRIVLQGRDRGKRANQLIHENRPVPFWQEHHPGEHVIHHPQTDRVKFRTR